MLNTTGSPISTLGQFSGLNVSIYGTGTIFATSGFLASSDERIKKNIRLIDDNEALEDLRLIEPMKYEYIDKIEKVQKKFMDLSLNKLVLSSLKQFIKVLILFLIIFQQFQQT